MIHLTYLAGFLFFLCFAFGLYTCEKPGNFGPDLVGCFGTIVLFLLGCIIVALIVGAKYL